MSYPEETEATTEESPEASRRWVRDLKEGDRVRGFYAVRATPERMGASNGVKIVIGDHTDVMAFSWKLGDLLRELVTKRDIVVYVEGVFSVHPEFGKQIEIHSIRLAEADKDKDKYDPLQLYPVFAQPLAGLELRLSELLNGFDSKKSVHLLKLLDALIINGPTAEMWRNVPAPILGEKGNAAMDEARDENSIYGCRHGLMASAVTAAECVSELAKIHGWPHDLAVACALLKHYGMVEALEPLEIGFQMTEEGLLEKPPMLGYNLVRDALDGIDGFPKQTARALRHTILANEQGTAINPLIRVVSGVCDVVDTVLTQGKFRAFEQNAAVGDVWGPYSGDLGGSAYLEPLD